MNSCIHTSDFVDGGISSLFWAARWICSFLWRVILFSFRLGRSMKNYSQPIRISYLNFNKFQYLCPYEQSLQGCAEDCLLLVLTTENILQGRRALSMFWFESMFEPVIGLTVSIFDAGRRARGRIKSWRFHTDDITYVGLKHVFL